LGKTQLTKLIINLIINKMSKDLNKHRQVKSVDSNTNIKSNNIDSMLGFPELILFRLPLWENLIKEYPNDTDLGRKIREAILLWKDE